MSFKVIKGLLWFSRILGLTFGGLTIDSNGRLFVNKYYKIYGYLFAVVVTTYDVYHFFWIFTEGYEAKRIYMSKYLSNFMSRLLPLIISSVGFCWHTLKIAITIYFNFYGFNLVKIVLDGFKDNQSKKLNYKINLVILLWVTQIAAFNCFTIFSLSEFSYNYQKLITMLDFNMVFIYSSTLASLLWVISIHTADKLNDIKNNLVKFITLKPGKMRYCFLNL